MKTGKIKIFKYMNVVPLVLLVVIHYIGSLYTGTRGTWELEISDFSYAAVITVMAMLLGEGYGAICFWVSGIFQHWVLYLGTIVMCVFSAGATIAGGMIAAIEMPTWDPMYDWFCGIYFVVIIVSIIQLCVVLANKKQDSN